MPTQTEFDQARAEGRRTALADFKRAMSIPTPAARAAAMTTAFGDSEETRELVAIACGRQYVRQARSGPATVISMTEAMGRVIGKSPEECRALGRAARVVPSTPQYRS